MTQNTHPSVDAFLCFALYSTALSMTQRYKPMLEALDVTYPQYLVLLILWNQQGLGIKDIAARLHQDPGSITPLVKRLEAQGYLTRKRDSRDARNIFVSLTPDGEALRGKGVEIRRSIEGACGMPDGQIDSLIQSLLALRSELESSP